MDPERFLAHYCLSQTEKDAIKLGDVGSLYKMGVLTASIAYLARAFGYSNADYIKKLRAAAELPEVPEQIEILKKRQ
jgi:hypothetical protein